MIQNILGLNKHNTLYISVLLLFYTKTKYTTLELNQLETFFFVEIREIQKENIRLNNFCLQKGLKPATNTSFWATK